MYIDDDHYVPSSRDDEDYSPSIVTIGLFLLLILIFVGSYFYFFKPSDPHYKFTGLGYYEGKNCYYSLVKNNNDEYFVLEVKSKFSAYQISNIKEIQLDYSYDDRFQDMGIFKWNDDSLIFLRISEDDFKRVYKHLLINTLSIN